jgi:CelD/BcsL family acetyltransferase involved in cellulose biosynthesis
MSVAARHARPSQRPGYRLFAIAVLLYLAVLAGAGFELGASAARGPGGTVASELLVDGCRIAERTESRSTAPRNRKRRLPPPPQPTNGASVRVARSVEGVEALRPLWTALQGPHFTSDIDVFLTVVQHAPGVVRPHVVVVEKDGDPVALVAGRIENARLPARLGYVGFSPRLRMLTVAYGGFLAARPSDTTAGLEALRGSLNGDRVDLVRLRMLEVGSAVHAAAREQGSALTRRRFSPELRHWQCAVPASFEEFLAARSKERRRHVRRYQRRLEEAFPGDVEVRHFTTRAELDRLFLDSERVQRRTYQRALGVGFTDDELSRRLAALTMDKGWFRGTVLYLRGEPAAFWHGNAYRGTFSTAVTGYDPELAEHRPGTYLLMKLVETLCADAEVHSIDFGFGDAEYKRSFGERSVLEKDVVVFEPRARPVAINVVQSALLGTGAIGRAVLAHSGAVGAVRRARRRRLSRPRGGD